MKLKIAVCRAIVLNAIIAIGAVGLSPEVIAASFKDKKKRTYRVTIVNATPGQPVAPSVIATHTNQFQLFNLGQVPVQGDDSYPLYFGLATLAETGSPMPLVDEVANSPGVSESVALLTDRTPPVLLPGESNSVTISASGRARYLSAVGMLGATNDAYYAVRGIVLPKRFGETVRIYANAYDAGSELNAETPDTVGALGATDDDPVSGIGINESGEGFIHVHGGVHGVGGPDGLDAATYDWGNPVVELVIERIK